MGQDMRYIVTVEEDRLGFIEVTNEKEQVIRTFLSDLREDKDELKGLYLVDSHYPPKTLKNVYKNPLKKWGIGRYDDDLYSPLFITSDSKCDAYRHHVAVQLAQELGENYQYSNYITKKSELKDLYSGMDDLSVFEGESESWVINLNRLLNHRSYTDGTFSMLDKILMQTRKFKKQLIFITGKDSPASGTLNIPADLKMLAQNIVMVHGYHPDFDGIFCTDFMVNHVDLHTLEDMSRELPKYFASIPMLTQLSLEGDVRDVLTVNPSIFDTLSEEELDEFNSDSRRFD